MKSARDGIDRHDGTGSGHGAYRNKEYLTMGSGIPGAPCWAGVNDILDFSKSRRKIGCRFHRLPSPPPYRDAENPGRARKTKGCNSRSTSQPTCLMLGDPATAADPVESSRQRDPGCERGGWFSNRKRFPVERGCVGAFLGHGLRASEIPTTSNNSSSRPSPRPTLRQQQKQRRNRD